MKTDVYLQGAVERLRMLVATMGDDVADARGVIEDVASGLSELQKHASHEQHMITLLHDQVINGFRALKAEITDLRKANKNGQG